MAGNKRTWHAAPGYHQRIGGQPLRPQEGRWWSDHTRLFIAIGERPTIDGTHAAQATVVRWDVEKALGDFLAHAHQRLAIDADPLIGRHVDDLFDPTCRCGLNDRGGAGEHLLTRGSLSIYATIRTLSEESGLA
jgi:hypothetical protein